MYTLRFFEDRLEQGDTGPLAPAPRILYARRGTVVLADAGTERRLSGTAALAIRASTVRGESAAVVWRFELSGAGAPEALLGTTTLKLAAPVAIDPTADFLFRCDRVSLCPGAVTPKHTHCGPGIRVLLSGHVHAEIGGIKSFHRAGEAWFERGPDPVVGTMSPDEPTSFVRALILPPELRGQTSYRPWDAEAAALPLPAQYEVLVDEVCRFRGESLSHCGRSSPSTAHWDQ
jgi:hypothetical protein